VVRRVDLRAPSGWPAIVAEAVSALRRDEVVVLPAEGLYGYHVRGDRPSALEALQRLKPREAGRGWILLLPDALPPGPPSPWSHAFSPRASALASAHWPGPLTMVLPAPPGTLPDLVASDGTVAVRCPGSDFLRAVLAAAEVPVVTTSANRPGGTPPARFEDCPLDGVALAVDGGPLSGLPSTVVRVDGSAVRVLRSGAVTLEGEAP
jgi:L-threonylcarbamoyladenylate synthase